MKNKSKIFKFTIFSIILVFILGTLLHFTFDWSNKNVFIGSFSAVNESTWEHLKLLFFPMIITTIIGYFYLSKTTPSFLCARVFSIISSILPGWILPSLINASNDLVAISLLIGSKQETVITSGVSSIIKSAPVNCSFYIATLIGEYISYRLMLSKFNCNTKKALILLSILLFLFVLFTYFPPKIMLFKDPISGTYGIIEKP